MGKKSGEKKQRWNPFKRTMTVRMAGKEYNVADLPASDGIDEVWFNNIYTVFLRRDRIEENGLGYIHLSIKRNDQEPIHDWRDLQRIKSEIAGEDVEAVELYPAESRVVDTANQYHLWCFPGMVFPFGWAAGLRLGAADKPVVGAPRIAPGSKQRAFRG